MPQPSITFHPLDQTFNAACLEVNRACPIKAEFIFRFDREPDFFGWPKQVFDSFKYIGIFAGDRLIGYYLLGIQWGWVGNDWEPWVYLGDFRIIPEFRGRYISVHALREAVRQVPESVRLGCFIIARGNRVARLVDLMSPPGVMFQNAGVLEVINLPVLTRPRFKGACQIRDGDVNDYPVIAALLKPQWEGHLFAPHIVEDRIDSYWEKAFAERRVLVAYRHGKLCGVLIWDNHFEVHRTTIMSYPGGSRLLRCLWASIRVFNRQISPLPKPGEAIRAITVRQLVAEKDNPLVLRELLISLRKVQVGRGVHLIQVAGFPHQGLHQATKGSLQFHVFNNVWIMRRADISITDNLLARPPVIDLAML